MAVDPLEKRVEALAAQVERLHKRVDELAAGMVKVVPAVAPAPPAASKKKPSVAGSGSDDIMAWAGTSSLLPRISTLCFLLVVAFALRTVTDSGVIEKLAGSLLGMVYAASLMVIGWVRYRRGSSIAPVFSLTGALLMYSIVVETHSHFGSLPTLPAYALLISTGLAMALTSRSAQNPAPMVVGTLGMCFAGIAINVPVATFPLLAALLVVANAVAFLTVPLLKRDWLRWVLFALTGLIIQVWAFRLGIAIANPDLPGTGLHPLWFIPIAALFGVFFFGTSIHGMIRFHDNGKRFFDYVVPTLGALVFFTAVRHVAVPLWDAGFGLGLAGVIVASAHMGVASWMVKDKKMSALEFNSFTFAAVLLLVLALSAATGALLAALPLLSAAAFHLAIISDRWQSGGTRIISYFFQVFVALALASLLAAGMTGIPILLGSLAAGTVGVVGFLHYRWCRSKPPPAHSIVFSRLDGRDYCGVALLLASLAGWFFFRIGAYQALVSVMDGDVGNAFSGIQSLLINAAATVFLAVSYVRRNRELRNVGLFITLIGAVKVFLFDLVGVEGLARVFSVFSFGIVAAVASYVLGRWQKLRDEPGRPAGTGAPETAVKEA